MIIFLKLPFPPTANHYNRQRVVQVNGKPKVFFFPTAKAKAFYSAVKFEVDEKLSGVEITDRVILGIDLHAPSNHRRDLSNYAKCVEDSLVRAGLIGDDSQVDKLTIRRCPNDPGKVGWVDVTIEVCDVAQPITVKAEPSA
jgi:crossover junction endodeoxyribonuclease RusA